MREGAPGIDPGQVLLALGQEAQPEALARELLDLHGREGLAGLLLVPGAPGKRDGQAAPVAGLGGRGVEGGRGCGECCACGFKH